MEDVLLAPHSHVTFEEHCLAVWRLSVYCKLPRHFRRAALIHSIYNCKNETVLGPDISEKKRLICTVFGSEVEKICEDFYRLDSSELESIFEISPESISKVDNYKKALSELYLCNLVEQANRLGGAYMSTVLLIFAVHEKRIDNVVLNRLLEVL